MAKSVLKNPGRALEIGAHVGTAFASGHPKAALSTLPEKISFYHTGRGVYLGKFIQIFILWMATPTLKLYASATPENNDSERRLEKMLNDVNSSNNSINNNNEVITFFKDKNNKSEKNFK